jgi:hypothetical protein
MRLVKIIGTAALLVVLTTSAGASIVLDASTTAEKEYVAQQRYRHGGNSEHRAMTPNPVNAWLPLPAAAAGSSGPNVSFYNGTLHHNVHGNNSYHVLQVLNPAPFWHIYCPGCHAPGSCTGVRANVSYQAQEHKCAYAFNGGPFGMTTPQCIGPMVSDSVIIHSGASVKDQACIGIGHDPSDELAYFVGQMPTADEATALLPRMRNMLCGFEWLVYDGESMITERGGLIAPRTIIGIHGRTGALVMAVQDGCELYDTGLTNWESAQWALDLGLKYAINLDGGGSSTVYANGKVANCPMSQARPFCHERDVVTITCITEP